MSLISRLSIASLILTLTLYICACEKDVPKLPFIGSNEAILAFGDSLTTGVGADEGKSYPQQLQKIIGRTVIGVGVNGEITSEGLERIDDEVDAYVPSLVIICHGGNDFLGRHDKRQTKGNILKMLAILRSKKIPAVLVAVPSLGLGLDPDPIYEEIAEQMNVPLEKETLSNLLSKREYKSDQIHLNNEGYALLADSIAKLLKKAGAI